jgi:hypothetical protein
MPTYEVVVGNIGTVYVGPWLREAVQNFDVYVDQSLASRGMRASGESVTFLCDGEIVMEHTGTLDKESES